jgi:ATP-dependent Clp protease protease subunit
MAKYKPEILEYFREKNVHIPSRTIYFSGIIEEVLAEDMIKTLRVLDDTPEKPITIIMDSPGGDVYASLAIFDFIRNCESEVIVDVYGKAMSGGSIILQAADYRRVSVHSSVLIHYGRQGFEGEHVNHINMVRDALRISRLMENIYLERIREKNPSYRREELKTLLKFDTYFNAEETVALGLADELITSPKRERSGKV